MAEQDRSADKPAAEKQPDDSTAENQEKKEPPAANQPTSRSLVDELGVEDLTDILFGSRGKIFSAAGRQSPVAQMDNSGVLLRPAHKPYSEDNQSEEITLKVDEKGILLNEFGEQRKIIGAKYKGHIIYALGELKPGTLKHYAAWFDENWRAHKLFIQGDILTVDMIYRLRNRTHDGEISIFPNVRTDA